MHPALAKANFDRDVALLTDKFLANRGWVVQERTFPVLDVTFAGSRPLRVRLTCDDWDELPPSAELLDPSGRHLVQHEIPGGIFNAGGHPITGRPFVCMRGFREFHNHSSHLAEVWETYRGQDGMNLPGLLDQLSVGWRKSFPR